MSQVAIPDLLMRTFTSFTWPYFEKKAPILSSQDTPWIVTFVLQAPKYSVCSLNFLAFKTLPANFLLAALWAGEYPIKHLSWLTLWVWSARSLRLLPCFPCWSQLMSFIIGGQQRYAMDIYSFHSFRYGEELIPFKWILKLSSLSNIVGHIFFSLAYSHTRPF